MYRDRRYGPDEVRRILERAAAGAGEDTVDAPPRTLEEIERLGEELGLSRAAVRRAAADPDAGARAPKRSVGAAIFGSPAKLRREVVVRGAFDASRHADVVEVLRARIGDVGRTEVLGDTLTWSCMTQSGGGTPRMLSVTFKPVAGGTRIRVEENLAGLAGGLYGGIGGGVGGGVGGGLSPLLSLLLHFPGWTIPFFILGWILLVLVFVRSLFGSIARRRERQHGELVTALASELDAEPAPARVSVPTRVAVEPSGAVEDEEAEDEEAVSGAAEKARARGRRA